MILAAFMVPHPPMIVPAVGKGSEKSIEKTVAAYERVAGEVAALEPETIIISSPHSIMYSDYFHISSGSGAKGSFADFGAGQVSFSEEYDSELVDTIEALAGKAGISAGTLGERRPELDHGTMVPLFFIRQRYKGGRIVRIGLSGLPLTDHYALGKIIREAADRLGRRAVYIASGDLSHKLKETGPYGFAPEGPEYDARIMDVCGRGAFSELFDFDPVFCDKATECGHRSFVMMAGALDGEEIEAKAYSHEDVTGVGYGICSFYPTGRSCEERRFLEIYLDGQRAGLKEKRDASDEYVKLARKTIEEYVTHRTVPEVPENLPPEMKEKRAGAFVSIHKQGELRGCIGTILPVTSCIAEEIIGNAVSAATRDPRFSPITADELEWLEINVDILGEPEDISGPEELDVKRYGVIVTRDSRRGLLLPDLEGVDTVKDQIAIAKRKAGIADGEEVRLQRFEVIRHF